MKTSIGGKIDRLAKHGSDDVWAEKFIDELYTIICEGDAIRGWLGELALRAAHLARKANANPVMLAEHTAELLELQEAVNVFASTAYTFERFRSMAARLEQ